MESFRAVLPNSRSGAENVYSGQMQLIALIDDDARVRNAISRLLKSAGYAVAEYGSGAAFLTAVVERRVLCIVLDLHMPGLNGFEVQEALARRSCGVPVIVVTAHADLEHCERALRLGAMACLAKPVDAGALLDAIAEACKRRRSA